MLSKSEMLKKYPDLETCIDNRLLKRLVDYLTVEELAEIGIQVKSEFQETWTVKKEWNEENIIKELISDAKFGMEKAEDERGISASLMTEVCEAWLVILEDDSIVSDEWGYNYRFFEEIVKKYSEKVELNGR